jgi:hypothetical protein
LATRDWLVFILSASARASFISTSAFSSSLSSRNSSVETRRHPVRSSLLRFAALTVHLPFIRNKLPFCGTTLARHSLLDLVLFKILKPIYRKFDLPLHGLILLLWNIPVREWSVIAISVWLAPWLRLQSYPGRGQGSRGLIPSGPPLAVAELT